MRGCVSRTVFGCRLNGTLYNIIGTILWHQQLSCIFNNKKNKTSETRNSTIITNNNQILRMLTDYNAQPTKTIYNCKK